MQPFSRTLAFGTAQDEQDLAVIPGMNVFSAAIVLSYSSLDEFLDKTPEGRVREFGTLLGVDRIVSAICTTGATGTMLTLMQMTFNRVISAQASKGSSRPY